MKLMDAEQWSFAGKWTDWCKFGSGAKKNLKGGKEEATKALSDKEIQLLQEAWDQANKAITSLKKSASTALSSENPTAQQLAKQAKEVANNVSVGSLRAIDAMLWGDRNEFTVEQAKEDMVKCASDLIQVVKTDKEVRAISKVKCLK